MELLRRVGILTDMRENIKVLEPSAGIGALILPLLQKMVRGEQFYKIDLVEIIKENRDILSKYKNATDNIQLMEEGNFMFFIPQDKYDYVVMNPPFHLKRADFPKLYKRDVWDIDFIKRAFGMLKVGGKLVALLSKKYVNNNDGIFGEFNDWLNTKNMSSVEATRKWKGSVGRTKAQTDRMNKLGMNKFMILIMTKEQKMLLRIMN